MRILTLTKVEVGRMPASEIHIIRTRRYSKRGRRTREALRLDSAEIVLWFALIAVIYKCFFLYSSMNPTKLKILNWKY